MSESHNFENISLHVVPFYKFTNHHIYILMCEKNTEVIINLYLLLQKLKCLIYKINKK